MHSLIDFDATNQLIAAETGLSVIEVEILSVMDYQIKLKAIEYKRKKSKK